MAKHEFSELESQYQGFQHPSALIKINDVALSDKKKGYPISDIRVDLTCGFEASIAEFSIYDVYSEEAGCFEFGRKKVKIYLGSKVEMYLGYSGTMLLVFVGVITRVNYLFEKGIDKQLKKVGEECTEVIIAGKADDKAETIYEIADLTYHVMVLMVEMGISNEDILKELASRHVIDHKVKQEKMTK